MMELTYDEAVAQVECKCCGDCVHAKHCPGMELQVGFDGEYVCVWYERLARVFGKARRVSVGNCFIRR